MFIINRNVDVKLLRLIAISVFSLISEAERYSYVEQVGKGLNYLPN